MYDAIVVGGGPSGSTIARRLAELDYNILLLEKEVMPRNKVCAGGVPSILEEVLRLDLSSIKEKEISDIIIRKGWKESHLKFDSPVLFTVERDKFDYFLLKLAGKKGTQIRYEKVMNIKKNTVITERSEYIGKVIVGADGAASIVRKDFFKPKRWLKTIEAEIDYPWEDGILIDIFNHSGYRWIFPKKGKISAGAGGLVSHTGNLEPAFHSFLSKLDIERDYKTYHYGYPIWISPPSLVKENRILIGDAGCLVNPFSGAGIFTGIISALIGAFAIHNFIREKFSLNIYNRLLKEFLYPELTAAFRLAIPSYLLPTVLTPFFAIKNYAKLWGKNNAYINIYKKIAGSEGMVDGVWGIDTTKK